MKSDPIFKKLKTVSVACSIPLLISVALMPITSPVYAGPDATQYDAEVIEGPLPAHPDFPFEPWTHLTDVNDHGIAVWWNAAIASATTDAFAYGLYDIRTGEFTTLGDGIYDYETDEETFTGVPVFGINNRGELVTGEDCGYVDNKGNYVPLTHPLSDVCSTRGISSNGQISGFTVDDEDTWTGFTFNPKEGVFEDFLPTDTQNIAQAINAKGQVAGGLGFGAEREGYIRDKDGTVRYFRVNIDGVNYPTRARGIASDGTIVGVYNADGAINGFVGRLPEDAADEDLVPDAVFTPANTPECGGGIFLSRVNNNGVIAGICYTGGFTQKGLLLTPVD